MNAWTLRVYSENVLCEHIEISLSVCCCSEQSSQRRQESLEAPLVTQSHCARRSTKTDKDSKREKARSKADNEFQRHHEETHRNRSDLRGIHPTLRPYSHDFCQAFSCCDTLSVAPALLVLSFFFCHRCCVKRYQLHGANDW